MYRPCSFLNIELYIHKVCNTGSNCLTLFHWSNTRGSACTSSKCLLTEQGSQIPLFNSSIPAMHVLYLINKGTGQREVSRALSLAQSLASIRNRTNFLSSSLTYLEVSSYSIIKYFSFNMLKI